MDEEALRKGCLNGDTNAQRALYEKYAPVLLGICYRYSNASDEAEDLLQEAFIKIFKHIKNFKGEGSFEGWMRRITVNQALKNLKKKKIKFDDIDNEHIQEPVKSAEADQNLNEGDLLGFLNKLPEGQRAVFNLYAIEGYNHQEISDMLGINHGTSKSQLAKAKNNLQGLHKYMNQTNG